MIASWCNGSTTDFGSACRGSNPREATISRSGAVVARWAHNPEVSGSIPLSATKQPTRVAFFYVLMSLRNVKSATDARAVRPYYFLFNPQRVGVGRALVLQALRCASLA